MHLHPRLAQQRLKRADSLRVVSIHQDKKANLFKIDILDAAEVEGLGGLL